MQSRPPVEPGAKDWNSRLLLVCSGQSLFGQVIRAAMKVPSRIGTVCSVTSDGFCMAQYTDGSGLTHHGALICSVEDLERNMAGVCKHLNFNREERTAFLALMQSWISIDYRTACRNHLEIPGE